MKIRHFLSHVEHDRVHKAIQAAEQGTSGRIVVYISHRRIEDPLEAAHRLFVKMKLETTENKTGLLLFVAPKTRKFAVVGGTALHEKLGPSWWNHLTGLIVRDFKEERYTDGIIAVIEEAGRSFHAHFPSTRPNSNRPDIIED